MSTPGSLDEEVAGTDTSAATTAAGGTDWTAMLKSILSSLGGTLGNAVSGTANSAMQMAPLLFLAEYLQKQADKSGMTVPKALANNEAMRDRYWTGMQAAGPKPAGGAPAPFNPYPKETMTTSGVDPQVIQMASSMASGQQPTLQSGQNLLTNTMALRGGLRAPRTGQVSGAASQLPLPTGATPLYGENASAVRPLAGGSAAIQDAWKTFNKGNADPGYTAAYATLAPLMAKAPADIQAAWNIMRQGNKTPGFGGALVKLTQYIAGNAQPATTTQSAAPVNPNKLLSGVGLTPGYTPQVQTDATKKFLSGE